MLSRASSLHEELPGFVEYVETLDLECCDPHLRLQSRLVDLNTIDFLGRFENLEADVATIFREIGLQSSGMNVVNSSSGRGHYRDYYDDDLAERVQKMYQKDIQIFGYTF